MAKLPRPKSCIVAEQVRPEGAGKSTILGFVGLSPDVEINVQSPPNGATAFGNISFLIVSERIEEGGIFDLEMELLGPQGAIISRRQLPVPEPAVVGKHFNLTLNFNGIPFAKSGRYEVSIFETGTLHSQHSVYANVS